MFHMNFNMEINPYLVYTSGYAINFTNGSPDKFAVDVVPITGDKHLDTIFVKFLILVGRLVLAPVQVGGMVQPLRESDPLELIFNQNIVQPNVGVCYVKEMRFHSLLTKTIANLNQGSAQLLTSSEGIGKFEGFQNIDETFSPAG